MRTAAYPAVLMRNPNISVCRTNDTGPAYG